MAAQEGAEAIFTAAGGGDVEEVRRLLDQDSGLLEARDEDYWERTPLICASEKGHMEVVKLLLDRGAEVNGRDAYGDTALLGAAEYGHEEVVAFLLSRGADASVRGDGEFTALHKVSCKGHVGVVRLLLQHLRGRGLDDQDVDRRTALWYASVNGRTEVARALLLAGADHTTTCLHHSNGVHNESTPLQAAQERGHEDTVILFKWWEGELERAYVVHKARRGLEVPATWQAPGAPVPAYLRVRAQGNKRVPEVQLRGLGGGRVTRGAAKRLQEQGEGEGPCEGEKQATLQYVMHDLAPELYIELMAGFH